MRQHEPRCRNLAGTSRNMGASRTEMISSRKAYYGEKKRCAESGSAKADPIDEQHCSPSCRLDSQNTDQDVSGILQTTKKPPKLPLSKRTAGGKLEFQSRHADTSSAACMLQEC